MMRERLLSALYGKRVASSNFNFDMLMGPSLYNFMLEQHISKLYNIATSLRMAGNINAKEKAIKEIMEPLGFRRFGSGTNRLLYSHLEDTNFLVKIAIDRAGLENSPKEIVNQEYLKPFVTKCFECHPTGVIATFERCTPITNRQEFLSVAEDIFDVIVSMVGEYILEDIGTDYFMNWVMRDGFGPILCDFPEMFRVDGNKLFCNRPLIRNQKFPVCGGTIDYDDGFNQFICTKCGKMYRARELSKALEERSILMEGDIDMKVELIKNGVVIAGGNSADATDTIRPPKKKRSNVIRSYLHRDGKDIFGKEEETEEPIGDATAQMLKDMETPKEETKPVEVEVTYNTDKVIEQIAANLTPEELKAVDELYDRMTAMATTLSEKQSDTEEDDKEDDEHIHTLDPVKPVVESTPKTTSELLKSVDYNKSAIDLY
jgi:hypothetical protein